MHAWHYSAKAAENWHRRPLANTHNQSRVTENNEPAVNRRHLQIQHSLIAASGLRTHAWRGGAPIGAAWLKLMRVQSCCRKRLRMFVGLMSRCA